MRILQKLRATVGAVPRSLIRRDSRKFLASTADCREVQRGVLRRLLSLNAESRFGKLHKLDTIHTVADFRRNLPVADYEYYREPIERMKQGDPSALLGPKNRLMMFTLSSGTTSQSKFIPITQQFLDDYRRGWQVWGLNAIDDYPQISSGQILQLCSDYDRFRSPGNTPCGNISGLVAAVQKRIVRTMYTIPQIVSKIRDADAKHYATLRLALADQSIRMVVTANPSTLIHLAKMAGTYRETLIRDIADGTLSSDFEIDNSIRSRLKRRIARPHRARARFLEQIVESTGKLSPRDYWPEMELVCVWTGGSAGAYLNSLKQFYGNVPIRDHGLSASEGRMTIPFHDHQPEGILDLNTHFFEFIPEEEHDSDNPTVLEAHELEEGENYFILLTTSSGLYRYDICDVVRCVGFYQTTPMLEFLHKGAHISNLTGEKISESQVVTAVRNCMDTMQIQLQHFTVSPVWGDPPWYQLLAEERDLATPDIGAGLAKQVDDQLQKLNCEYQDKRATGRLAAMKWSPLPAGTWKTFSRQCQSKLGGSFEQYKHPCLVPDLEFGSRLTANGKSPKAA
jgi:hypothetical protein